MNLVVLGELMTLTKVLNAREGRMTCAGLHSSGNCSMQYGAASKQSRSRPRVVHSSQAQCALAAHGLAVGSVSDSVAVLLHASTAWACMHSLYYLNGHWQNSRTTYSDQAEHMEKDSVFCPVAWRPPAAGVLPGLHGLVIACMWSADDYRHGPCTWQML